MEIQKTYYELHKQLIRKQRNPQIELLFFAWCFVSVKSEFRLPEELSIKTWIKKFYISANSSSDLKGIFAEIEKHIPNLKNCFSLLFDTHINKFRRDNSVTDLELYASVFSRFPFEGANLNDWHEILNLITEDITRKDKALNADPVDLSKLAANIFVGQLGNISYFKKNKLNTVFIPSLSTGAIAIEISQKTSLRFHYAGFERNMEVYCLAIISFLISDLDTSDIYFGEKDDIKMHQWDYIISFLNSEYVENDDQLEKWFRVIAFNSEITIAVTSQSFLFSKRFAMIRRQLLNSSNLSSVISLAPSVFSNSRMKYAMLIFNKNSKTDKVLLVNGENLDWSTKRIVKYTQKEIIYLSEIVTRNIEKEGVSKLIDVRDLRSDNYSLLVSKRLPEEKTLINLKQIQKRVINNQQQLMGYEYTLQWHFNKLISDQ